MARSSQQYRAKPIGADEGLRLALIRLTKQYGRYGHRKIAKLLRIEGWGVNHKQVELVIEFDHGEKKGFSSCRDTSAARAFTTETLRSSGCDRNIQTTFGASTSSTTS